MNLKKNDDKTDDVKMNSKKRRKKNHKKNVFYKFQISDHDSSMENSMEEDDDYVLHTGM